MDEARKELLRQKALEQWADWREHPQALQVHSEATSDGTKEAYDRNPTAWKKSDEAKINISKSLEGNTNRRGKPHKLTEEMLEQRTDTQRSLPKPNQAKLTKEDVRYIRDVLIPFGIPLVDIAYQYEVVLNTVRNIESGRTWAWLK